MSARRFTSAICAFVAGESVPPTITASRACHHDDAFYNPRLFSGHVGAMAAKPVAIIMGSQSDWATLKHAADVLESLGVAFDARIVSAHRTPERLYAFGKGAK